TSSASWLAIAPVATGRTRLCTPTRSPRSRASGNRAVAPTAKPQPVQLRLLQCSGVPCGAPNSVANTSRWPFERSSVWWVRTGAITYSRPPADPHGQPRRERPDADVPLDLLLPAAPAREAGVRPCECVLDAEEAAEVRLRAVAQHAPKHGRQVDALAVRRIERRVHQRRD